MSVRVTTDPQAVEQAIRSTSSSTFRFLTGQATKLQAATKSSLKSGFPAQFLGPSIVKRPQRQGNKLIISVGSSQLQTRPHRIDGRPVLAFQWPKRGPGTFFFRYVNHPGSDFSEYLSRKLREAARLVL